jgi:hypothetical protein
MSDVAGWKLHFLFSLIAQFAVEARIAIASLYQRQT